jgi:hypothetical protein
MRWRRGVPPVGLVLLLLCSAAADAQAARVRKKATLRQDPSTAHRPLRVLMPPAELELLSYQPGRGYYNVRTGSGEEGWVHRNGLEKGE